MQFLRAVQARLDEVAAEMDAPAEALAAQSRNAAAA